MGKRWWRNLIPLTKAKEHAQRLAEESRRDRDETIARTVESYITSEKLARRVRENHFSDGMRDAMRRRGLT